MPANYTVMVTNLPKDLPQYELERKLRTHFQTLLSKSRRVDQDCADIKVADINFGVNNAEYVSLSSPCSFPTLLPKATD